MSKLKKLTAFAVTFVMLFAFVLPTGAFTISPDVAGTNYEEAAYVLGALGIVKDRHATIYPGIEDKLIGAAPLTDEVVVDGNVITSRAPGTAIPFAIALAELLTDEKTAAALTEDLVFRKA